MSDVLVRYYGVLEEPKDGFFSALDQSASVEDDPQVFVFELGGPEWVPTDAQLDAFDARVASLSRPRVVRRHLLAEQVVAIRDWTAGGARRAKRKVKSKPAKRRKKR